jgi:uncharacterized membrane protein YhaH (DUF805 family)
MKKSNNLNHVLEVFWLIVAMLTAIMGIFALVRHGFKSSYMFFLMAIVSFLLYYARHALRLRDREKTNE